MIQPLDFQTILVNYFSGSTEVFFFLALVVLSMLAAYFRMSNMVYGLLMVLFVLLMAVLNYKMGLILIIIVVAMIVSYIINKTIKN